MEALYRKVIANPAIEKYRGYTETKSYGWDAAAAEYIKEDGECWFENPQYDPAFVPEGECCSASAELLDEQLAARDAEIGKLHEEREELCRVIDALNQKLAAAQSTVSGIEGERDRAIAALRELRDAVGVIRRWIISE